MRRDPDDDRDGLAHAVHGDVWATINVRGEVQTEQPLVSSVFGKVDVTINLEDGCSVEDIESLCSNVHGDINVTVNYNSEER